MEETNGGNLFELFCGMIEAFDPCMDDYLYVFDVRNDQYYISKKAMKRFAIPSFTFHNVLETHKQFVYPDDVAELEEDLGLLLEGKKLEHNLTYRWLGVDKEPIWITCRGRMILGTDGRPEYFVGCINEAGTKPIADNVSGLLESLAIKEAWNQKHDRMTNGFALRIGIDSFKTINEKFGVEYGDFILHEVANCIQSCMKENQKVFRVVADEFLIIDPSGGTQEDAKTLYRAIRSHGIQFIRVENNTVDSVVKALRRKVFFFEKDRRAGVAESLCVKILMVFRHVRRRNKNACPSERRNLRQRSCSGTGSLSRAAAAADSAQSSEDVSRRTRKYTRPAPIAAEAARAAPHPARR